MTYNTTHLCRLINNSLVRLATATTLTLVSRISGQIRAGPIITENSNKVQNRKCFYTVTGAYCLSHSGSPTVLPSNLNLTLNLSTSCRHPSSKDSKNNVNIICDSKVEIMSVLLELYHVQDQYQDLYFTRSTFFKR